MGDKDSRAPYHSEEYDEDDSSSSDDDDDSSTTSVSSSSSDDDDSDSADEGPSSEVGDKVTDVHVSQGPTLVKDNTQSKEMIGSLDRNTEDYKEIKESKSVIEETVNSPKVRVGPHSPPSDTGEYDEDSLEEENVESGAELKDSEVKDVRAPAILSEGNSHEEVDHTKNFSHTDSKKPAGSSTTIEHGDDNIELDYDIDIAQDLSAADLTQHEQGSLPEEDSKKLAEVKESEGSSVEKKPPAEDAPKKKTEKQPKKTKDLDESEEEGELSDTDGELTTTDDEKAAEEEVEEGEIQDGRSFNARTQLCRFFARGLCTWGYTCRFLHPGVNDKGNYQLIERPGMRPPMGIYKPPEEEAEEKKEEEEAAEEEETTAPVIEEPPKPETPWERGLRQAKEALKRASRKKEMELDIEEKKMHMTLDDVKNKDIDLGGKDPYYDSLQYDELDPIQAMAFEENREDNWEKAGFEDTFEVEWTHANYELPHMQAPPEREWRDERMRGGDPRRGFERGARQRYRSPVRSSRRDFRDRRPPERRGLNRQALGTDGWVDPWQRVKPGDRRRNRRRSSSGSSSFSSLSGSSRHSSASSFSSRSRSRTRTPTPLRNVPKPKSFIAPSNTQRSDDKRGKDQTGATQEQRPARRGPEWPSGPAANADRQTSLVNRDKPSTLPDRSREKATQEAASNRPSRKDQPLPSRKDKTKHKRRRNSSYSSSSSSSSSDSSSSRSRSSSSSDSSGSSSSSDSSSSSSSSDSSASDSDDLYAGISKPHKERHRKKSEEIKQRPKERRAPPPPSRPTPVARKQRVEEPVRETTTSTSKAGIKLTLVNKAKVPSKKRVLESPPPEPLPPSKKPNLPMPEKADRPKPPVPKVPVLAPSTTKTRPAAKPVPPPGTSNKPSKSSSKSASVPAKKSQPNRREELLKQLKAVEDAIAKKRSKT